MIRNIVLFKIAKNFFSLIYVDLDVAIWEGTMVWDTVYGEDKDYNMWFEDDDGYNDVRKFLQSISKMFIKRLKEQGVQTKWTAFGHSWTLFTN